jgi:hypothetical protein
MDLHDKVTKALRKGFLENDEGITDGIIRICVEHAEEEQLWLVAENCDLRQTVEELEIELMLMENAPMPEWKREAAAKELNFKRYRVGYKQK